MSFQSQTPASPLSPLGTLASLPLEIRQEIYSLVLASTTSLIGTSSVIKAEASPILYRQGIRRTLVKFNRIIIIGHPGSYYDPSNWHSRFCSYPDRRPDWRVKALIQNTSITVDMREPYVLDRIPRGAPTFPEAIHDIIDTMQKKRHCHIAFVLGSCCELSPYREPMLLNTVTLLKGFESITVELKKRPWETRYPVSFGGRTVAEADVVAVKWFKMALGWHDEAKTEGVRKLRIMRSSVDVGRKPEILWDSETGFKERVDEDGLMGEN